MLAEPSTPVSHTSRATCRQTFPRGRTTAATGASWLFRSSTNRRSPESFIHDRLYALWKWTTRTAADLAGAHVLGASPTGCSHGILAAAAARSPPGARKLRPCTFGRGRSAQSLCAQGTRSRSQSRGPAPSRRARSATTFAGQATSEGAPAGGTDACLDDLVQIDAVLMRGSRSAVRPARS